MAIRVALVDDHALVREGLRALLEREGDIEVVGETGSAAGVLALAGESRPEVVVMDLQLGAGRNGVEATRELVEKKPEIKVVILSMYDDEDLVFRALEAGARGYVLKRAGVEELITAIRLVARGEAYLDPQIARRVIEGLQERLPFTRASRPEGPELTERELEVLRLAAEGLTNAEIARRLVISVKTVQAHRANIMQKLGLHDRVDLVKYAIKNGILKLDSG